MFVIRRFQAADQESAQNLIKQIMETEFAAETQAYPFEDLADIQKTYGNVGEAFFVGIEDGTIVGTVAVKKEDERTALLRRIFVSPQYRNRRYGHRLVEEAVHFCKVVGYQELVFKTTSKMQGAIALCQNKGFTEKAKLNLGGLQIFKFALFIKENSPLGGKE